MEKENKKSLQTGILKIKKRRLSTIYQKLWETYTETGIFSGKQKSNSVELTQDGTKHLNKLANTKGVKVVVKCLSHKKKTRQKQNRPTWFYPRFYQILKRRRG